MSDYMARLEKIEAELEKLKEDMYADKGFKFSNVSVIVKTATEKVNDAVYELDVATKFTGKRADVGDTIEVVGLFDTYVVSSIEDGEYKLGDAKGDLLPYTCPNYEITRNVTKDISYE